MDFTLFLIYLVLTPIVFGLIFRAIAKSRRSFAMPAALAVRTTLTTLYGE